MPCSYCGGSFLGSIRCCRHVSFGIYSLPFLQLYDSCLLSCDHVVLVPHSSNLSACSGPRIVGEGSSLGWGWGTPSQLRFPLEAPPWRKTFSLRGPSWHSKVPLPGGFGCQILLLRKICCRTVVSRALCAFCGPRSGLHSTPTSEYHTFR